MLKQGVHARMFLRQNQAYDALAVCIQSAEAQDLIIFSRGDDVLGFAARQPQKIIH